MLRIDFFTPTNPIRQRKAVQNTFAFAHVPWTAWVLYLVIITISAIRINRAPLVSFVSEHYKVSHIFANCAF
jgi:hypothetical protein